MKLSGIDLVLSKAFKTMDENLTEIKDTAETLKTEFKNQKDVKETAQANLNNLENVFKLPHGYEGGKGEELIANCDLEQFLSELKKQLGKEKQKQQAEVAKLSSNRNQKLKLLRKKSQTHRENRNH